MKNKKSVSGNENEMAGDIIDLILDDHKDLKRLIKVLKNDDTDIGDRYAAFEEFAPLLTLHAKPEEQTLYVEMKNDKELRSEGMEGDIEHAIADRLLNEAKETTDEDMWSAKVKVLAELVEHHIKEEESTLLPDYKKHSETAERIQLGEKFMALKSSIGMDDPMFSAQVKSESQYPSIH